jgi:hypothetical protein
MPLSAAGLRFPYERTLLPRTKLAYVHLRNLLTDAKRDRAARVFGYVAIWLPEEFLMLYMQRGEVVNATTYDGRVFHAVAIAEALERVPPEPEFGEICFHEADPEQLACMYQTQAAPPVEWPSELSVTDPTALFPYLLAMTFDGLVEIEADGGRNYLLFRNGTVRQAFVATSQRGTLVERIEKLFGPEMRAGMRVRRWAPPPPLPEQAPPALVQAYRDLTTGLVQRLVAAGNESTPAIAEHARATLVERHPALSGFASTGSPRGRRDPVADTPALSAAVAAWVQEVVWAAADPEATPHEQLLRELTWDRRHVFQSAGLFEHLPWKVS